MMESAITSVVTDMKCSCDKSITFCCARIGRWQFCWLVGWYQANKNLFKYERSYYVHA